MLLLHFQIYWLLKFKKETTLITIKSLSHLSRQWNCWSLRCSWSITCRRCSNYIFILDLTHGFNMMHRDNCTTRREAFKFGDLVWLILEIWWYLPLQVSKKKLELHSGPPSDTSHDWIGPADSDSNLRPIKHNIPEKESRIEREFRQLVEQTQKWNQEYWASHNKNFFQVRIKFERKNSLMTCDSFPAEFQTCDYYFASPTFPGDVNCMIW